MRIQITPLTFFSFAAVYLIWGSTYLGIRIAVETLPPFLCAALRFTVAGGLLYLAARLLGAQRPSSNQWRSAAVVGLCLTTLGNGLVVVAEQRIPSAVAALIVPLVSIWLTLLGWMFGEKRKPSGLTTAGLILGIVGVALLSIENVKSTTADTRPLDIALLIAATIAWAIGSIFTKNADLPKSIMLTTGMQMLAGTAFLYSLSWVTGEPQTFSVSRVSTNSWMALLYLTTFGSIVAFSAYSYLIRTVTPSLLGTYAFVNPLIAMILGAAFYSERFGNTEFLSAATILLGVGLILLGNSRKKGRSESTVPAPGSFEIKPLEAK